MLQQAEQGMLLEVQNAKADFSTYADDYQSQIKNLELTHRIYKRTFVAFREGVLGSMELTQAHNQYLTTQGTYFNSLLQLLNANSKLIDALNNY
jgi:outer membrane protein TolC